MKKIVLVVWALFIAFGVSAKTAVIYHTSDTHGFFYPKNGRGGFAALAALLKAETNPYLLLDAGDFAEGTIETKTSKGLKAVDLMNRVGYQAATLGNHEFAYGEDALKQLIAAAQFPILAANLREKESGLLPPHVLPYKIFDLNGIKVAVIGLSNSKPNRSVANYTFAEPLETLEQALSQKEVQEADVRVVLVHDSIADDKPQAPFYVGDIARKMGDKVQLVLGGHAHKIIKGKRLNDVLFVEVGANLQSVGKITLQTDDTTGKVQSISVQMIPLLVAKTGQDAQLAAYAETLKEPGMDEVLGEAADTLTLPPAQGPVKDGGAGNWIADVAHAYSGADVFVHNSAGVRMKLEKGPVARRDLLALFPFDDTIVTMPVTGEFLTELVRSSLQPRNLLSYSGLTVSYRLDKKNRIKKLQILVHGKKIDKEKTYLLATNSYMATGRGEGKLLAQIPDGQKTAAGPKSLRELLEEALARGPVHAPDTGRVLQRK